MGCSQAKAAKSYVELKISDLTPPMSPARKRSRSSGASASEKELANVENKEYRAIMQFLSKVPLFQRLPRDQHPILAGACERRDFEGDSFVVQEGDVGTELYVVRHGEARVLVQGRGEVAKLGAGDYFGESALLRNEPRIASVQAIGPLSTLKITREKFQDLGLTGHLQFANRKAVGGGGGQTRDVKLRPPCRKMPAEYEAIMEALKANENLQMISSLDTDRMRQMAEVAWPETVASGMQIITQGDLAADYFYIVKSGSFDVQVTNMSAEPMSAESAAKTRRASRTVGNISSGGSFGELALLYAAPRAATIVAKEDSVVWVIDRGNFKKILMQASSEKIDEYVKYLDSVEILKNLRDTERRAVAEAMVEMHFTKDEVVLRQGEPGSTFYVLCEGEAVVVKDNLEQVRLTANPHTRTAQYFGERALLNKEPRAATVIVTSQTAKVLALDQESFNLLLGPLEDIFKRRARASKDCLHCFNCFAFATPPQRLVTRQAEQQAMVIASSKSNATGCSDRARVMKKDLVRIGLLGCGAFGTVELYEHKETGESYAMKGLSKGFVVKTGMQDSVMSERFILMMTNSPFIIALLETFNGSQTLYFLLEAALGGELHATYIRKDFYGSAPHARYYTGGVVLAFEHLHERRIIYRDLKPENLLLNDKGHLKVTDMGLSKFVIGKTYTTCGTPDYFAPEIIDSTGHTIAVDWWMLGILLFELMTGHPPFESDSPMQIYAKVLKGINKVTFPHSVEGQVGDLVKEILKKEPSQRLPMRPGSTANLKQHGWFSGFTWVDLESLEMQPPYLPKVKSKTDIANFTVRPEDLPQQIPYVDNGTGWDKDFASA
mmetsp:Transcript_88067/g.221654  ORF Transcript_88067/g.221654 Transcript_88067/m.221654 type:complete len:836 (-) Transcript_88067:101-2608(-)